ncbi:phosphoribosylformylglycinamidine synthase subunit PurS [Camelliibacillus cellulosilyticus]|uniref:Phosphoribosylformylglycinamidine synthase subunit PurS n=1 Tax=Camelliibacillus cellulosilyticus TaxID=2174486 RepID=A0ABV9GM19_9BACL
MKKVTVTVTLKESVLDPQGKAVQGALHNLGYKGVGAVRVGKLIEFDIADEDHVEAAIDDMCKKLLANTVIEDYHYQIEEVVTE